MNRELTDCLRSIGFLRAEDPLAWQRVAIVVNYGRVPARLGELDKGFKLLLLNESGETSWFARCGWAAPDAMEREVQLLEVLGQDSHAKLHIPESRWARGPKLFLQASRYLGDNTYRSLLAGRSALQWAQDIEEILALSERLMRTAQRLHRPFTNPPSAAERRLQVERDLATLETNGLTSISARALQRALEGAEHLPAELQHGDLWPANILRAENRWWLIDFTESGMVWSPLYDLLHLLAYAPTERATPWYATLSNGNAWTRARNRIFRNALGKRGFDAQTGGVCLAYYVTHLAAYRLRPGVSRGLGAAMLTEAERVGRYLATYGPSPSSLLMNS